MKPEVQDRVFADLSAALFVDEADREGETPAEPNRLDVAAQREFRPTDF